MDRRTFLARVVQVCSVAIAALTALPVVRFLFASSQSEPDQWISIPVPSEEVSLVTYRSVLRDGWINRIVEGTVWVRRKEDGSCIVFDPHCTHLGCAVSWNQDATRFECPCHGGKYDVEGKRTAGPPPRPLDRYESAIQDNILRFRKPGGNV